MQDQAYGWSAERITENEINVVKITQTNLSYNSVNEFFFSEDSYTIASVCGNRVYLWRSDGTEKMFLCLDNYKAMKFAVELNDSF